MRFREFGETREKLEEMVPATIRALYESTFIPPAQEEIAPGVVVFTSSEVQNNAVRNFVVIHNGIEQVEQSATGVIRNDPTLWAEAGKRSIKAYIKTNDLGADTQLLEWGLLSQRQKSVQKDLLRGSRRDLFAANPNYRGRRTGLYYGVALATGELALWSTSSLRQEAA